ncbi:MULTISPECIES: hypothetical protein [unclassified Streptomyces]|uniref:hypothetical protein n=1 Tax=unclassified Streptomyces TaxID=2593676 RepID=UPI00332A4111
MTRSHADQATDVAAKITALPADQRSTHAGALYDRLRADAAREATAAVTAHTDPAAQRTEAADIATRATNDMDALRPERDALLASAVLYGTDRHKDIAASFGISYSTLRRAVSEALGLRAPRAWPTNLLEAAAAAAGITHTPDALDRGVAISVKHELARGRRDAARTIQRAAHEAVRLAGGRVHVPAPERPDFNAIRAQATQEVQAEFAVFAGRAEERARHAVQIIEQADDEIALLLPERDAALATLALYTDVRGPYIAAGLTRQALPRVLERTLGLPRGAELPSRVDQPAAARAAGVPFVEDAHLELPMIAKIYEAARARRTTAIEVRNAAVAALHDGGYGWTQVRIAELIGRDVALVNRTLPS